jgi:hypothetical protein
LNLRQTQQRSWREPSAVDGKPARVYERAREQISPVAHTSSRIRIIFMRHSVQLVVVLVLLSMSAGPICAAESLDESIKYLLDYVAKSDATFIRNGQAHTPQEAANHIKAKYEHFKNEIKTPEDFIRLSASKSLLTGQPYLVRTRDGKQRRLDEWLAEALKEHQKESGR